MANETVGNVHECLLAGQARYLLDEMDARNAPRMAFWLSTLFQTDTIEDIIGERINRDEEMFYYASSGVDNSKTILAEMKCEGFCIYLFLKYSFSIFRPTQITDHVRRDPSCQG